MDDICQDGYEGSQDAIQDMFRDGLATKEAQYAEALRGYQNAPAETWSPQREWAKAVFSSQEVQKREDA